MKIVVIKLEMVETVDFVSGKWIEIVKIRQIQIIGVRRMRRKEKQQQIKKLLFFCKHSERIDMINSESNVQCCNCRFQNFTLSAREHEFLLSILISPIDSRFPQCFLSLISTHCTLLSYYFHFVTTIVALETFASNQTVDCDQNAPHNKSMTQFKQKPPSLKMKSIILLLSNQIEQILHCC